MSALVRYPGTPHLEGSGEAPGRRAATPFAALGPHVRTWEEKVDGDHCGIGFDPWDGAMFLQAHGREVAPGAEPRFATLEAWAGHHAGRLRDALGRRYVVFGDWCEFKHTAFYDALPHLFLEYDVHDRETGAWLSTWARERLLAGLPLAPVPVLSSGPPADAAAARLLAEGEPSRLRTPRWREALAAAAAASGVDTGEALAHTDPSAAGEGLYLKVEDGDAVVSRHKFVRAGFLSALRGSGSHWSGRRRLRNGLADGVDPFA